MAAPEKRKFNPKKFNPKPTPTTPDAAHGSGNESAPAATAASDSAVEYAVGGTRIVLHLPNESYSKISADNVKPFSGDAAALITATRAVREQDLFAGIDLEALAESYAFAPFRYQIENVRTMLTRFEGHGVFGDQVGLGKTAEALMTAHAMFESGTIKNALIVVPEKTLEGWCREIRKKFCGIFDLTTYEDVKRCAAEADAAALRYEREHPNGEEAAAAPKRYPKSPFLAVLHHVTLDQENEEKTGRKRLYLISSDILQGEGAGDMTTYLRERIYYEILERPLTEREAARIREIERGMSADALSAILEEFSENHTRAEDPDDLSEFGRGAAYELLPISVCRALEERLLPFLPNAATIRASRGPGNARRVDECRKLAQDAYGVYKAARLKKERELADGKLLQSLFGHGGGTTRLVDLLIVDEIHSYYDDPQKGADLKEAPSYVNLLADINKKFCVLISATPIRKQLRDVYDLLRIARPSLFAHHKQSERAVGEVDPGLEYFCKTFCRLADADPDRLLLHGMFQGETRADGTTQNAGSRFFGLINNFFTRSRIHSVEEQMRRTEDAALVTPDSVELRILLCLRERIVEKGVLQWMQRGGDPDADDADALITKRFEEFISGAGRTAGHKDERRHTRAAIDSVLMEVIDKTEDFLVSLYYGTPAECPEGLLSLLKCADPATREITADDATRTAIKALLHRLYRMVDWRRKRKEGILVVPETEARVLGSAVDNRIAPPAPDEKILSNVAVVPDRLTPNGAPDLDAFRAADGSRLVTTLTGNHTAHYQNFALAYANGGVVYYVSRSRSWYNGRTDVFDAMKRELSAWCTNHQGDNSVRTVDYASAFDTKANPNFFKIGRGNHNRILLVDSSCQAGVNLQEYSTLVLYQLDVAGKRILDPVDIEQWIGRIHRTGQTRTSRIVTVLTAHMLPERCYELCLTDREHYARFVRFLRWYYDFLSDPAGLDIFGDTTPDVAFLQPLIHEYLRAKSNDANPDDCLSELMYRYYESVYDCADREERLEAFLKQIRAYCRIAGFGKKIL